MRLYFKSLYYNHDHEIKVSPTASIQECKTIISDLFHISTSFFRLQSTILSVEVILSESFPINFYFPDIEVAIIKIQEINIPLCVKFNDLLFAIDSKVLENFQIIFNSFESPFIIALPGQNKKLTLAHYAVIKNSFKILDFILDQNPDLLNQVTSDGFSPLILASSCGYIESLRVLFKRKNLDKDLVTNKGSALHSAVKAEQVAIVEYLCMNGCSVLTTDHKGKSAVEVAWNQEIIGILNKFKDTLYRHEEIKKQEPVHACKVFVKSSGIFSDEEVIIVVNWQSGRIEEYKNKNEFMKKQAKYLIEFSKITNIVKDPSKKNRFYINLEFEKTRRVYYLKHEEQRNDLIEKITQAMQKSNPTSFTSTDLFQLADNNHQGNLIPQSLSTNLKPDDFERISEIGEGSYGKVYKVFLKSTNQVFAMKCLSKPFLIRQKMLEYAEREIEIMKCLNHPFIVKMVLSISLDTRFYLLLEYCEQGDLESLVSGHKLSEIEVKFLLAEIVLGLEYLHSQQVIYRDLKLENVLIDQAGHVRLADFGLSRKLNQEANVASTLVGSPAYMSPEILKRKEVSKASDIFSLGVVMHQMITGELPFGDLRIDKVFQCIKTGKFSWDNRIRREDLELVKMMMKVDPEGRPSLQEIKAHQFFKGINWETLMMKGYRPPRVDYRK